MAEISGPNENARVGNEYPIVAEDGSLSREHMFYKYHNSVEDVYAGDVRIYVKKFEDYLKSSKASVYDPQKKSFIPIPVRYSAPNLAFSDNLMPGSSGVAPESSLQDRPALPLISFFLADTKRDASRCVSRVVRHNVRPLNPTDYSRAIVSHAPIPIDYQFQVDVWTEYREYYYQLLTAFLHDFNPYSYLYDIYDIEDSTQKLQYTPYAQMLLDSYSDSSNFIPGSDRRVVRGVFRITVKGWLTPPIHKLAYTHSTNIVQD